MGWVSTDPVRSRKRLCHCYLLILLQTSLPNLRVARGKQLPSFWLCCLVSILLKDTLRFGQTLTLTHSPPPPPPLSLSLSLSSPSLPPSFPPSLPCPLSLSFSPCSIHQLLCHRFLSNVSFQVLRLSPTFNLAKQTGNVLEQMSRFSPELRMAYALRGERGGCGSTDPTLSLLHLT